MTVRPQRFLGLLDVAGRDGGGERLHLVAHHHLAVTVAGAALLVLADSLLGGQ
jgi:hypothetical protein